MTNIIDTLWKEDPLKTASESVQKANFGPSGRDTENAINVSLLILGAILLALTKSLYGQAGYTLVQHVIASAILVFIGYLIGGLILFGFGPYVWVNNRLRCFLSCFIAALIISLCLFYLEEPIIDAGIGLIDPLPISEWLKNRLPNLAPPIVFSALGCAAIYQIKKHAKADRGRARVYFAYWIATTVFFYFAAFDREWFFVTVMHPLSNIKVF